MSTSASIILAVDRSTLWLAGDELLQNLLRVFETLGNLRITSNQLVREVIGVANPVFVDIGDMTLIGSQEDLRVIVKDNLYSVVAESEENGMLCSNPLLQVD